MVTHTVVFRPKEGTTEEQIMRLLVESHALVGVIPGLLSVTTGRQVRERSSEYTWGFTMYLSDKVALDGYYPNSAHRAFGEKLRGIAEKILDFDIVDE